MAVHFHSLCIKDIRKETPDCVSIAFEIPPSIKNEFDFIQGQNITVKKTIVGEDCRRSYSICSSPLDNELRIAVKKIPGGKFSEWANTSLHINDTLDILPPTGSFFTALQNTQQKNYVGFAAGSGITPLLSIIKTTLITEPFSSFNLFYGNRTKESILFKEDFDALKNKFPQRFNIQYILSREPSESPLNQGRIDAEKCNSIFQYVLPLHTCDEFFLCGPEDMIFTIKNFLENKKVPAGNIHFELFTSPGQNKNSFPSEFNKLQKQLVGRTAQVTIKLDGRSISFDLPFDGPSVLDAALGLGLDLPFACKGGVCASCRAKLIAGEVVMDNNYALEPDEISNGFILSCQAHPRSEKLSIDFDIK